MDNAIDSGAGWVKRGGARWVGDGKVKEISGIPREWDQLKSERCFLCNYVLLFCLRSGGKLNRFKLLKLFTDFELPSAKRPLGFYVSCVGVKCSVQASAKWSTGSLKDFHPFSLS